jgi:hypothetical protein
MWEWLAWIGLVAGIAGLSWLLARHVRRAQARARGYGNPDHWDGAGDHSE